jgi:hypothetical protein
VKLFLGLLVLVILTAIVTGFKTAFDQHAKPEYRTNLLLRHASLQPQENDLTIVIRCERPGTQFVYWIDSNVYADDVDPSDILQPSTVRHIVDNFPISLDDANLVVQGAVGTSIAGVVNSIIGRFREEALSKDPKLKTATRKRIFYLITAAFSGHLLGRLAARPFEPNCADIVMSGEMRDPKRQSQLEWALFKQIRTNFYRRIEEAGLLEVTRQSQHESLVRSPLDTEKINKISEQNEIDIKIRAGAFMRLARLCLDVEERGKVNFCRQDFLFMLDKPVRAQK